MTIDTAAHWCAQNWPWWLLLTNLLASTGAVLWWRRTQRDAARTTAWRAAPPVLALVLFAVLAELHTLDLALRHFDTALAVELQQRVAQETLRGWLLITRAGDASTRAGVGVAGALLLLCFRRPLWAAGWVLALAGVGAVTQGFKLLYARARPEAVHGLVTETSWSFPSGHASGALVTYGMLAFVLLRLTPPQWHVATLLAATVVIVNTGFSRVILQVHYASDVLAGFALGLVWLALCIALVLHVERRLRTASGS